MPRAFQLTINKVEEWGPILQYLESLSYNYIIACQEFAPKTNHEHIHVYIQLKTNIKKLSKSKILNAHVETCYGSPQQNINYIKKGNVVYEEGTPRLTGRLSIKDVKNLSKEDRDDLPIHYLNKVQMINQNEMNVMDANTYLKNVEVYYVYGESGIGKTKLVIEKIKELYKNGKLKDTKFNEVKYTNGFWCGVDADNITKVALYDDFRDSHMKASEFINFIDYNTHNLNVKYGNVKNTFEYIFITSIQSPYDIYSGYDKKNDKSIFNKDTLFQSNEKVDNEPNKQWIRRFKET